MLTTTSHDSVLLRADDPLIEMSYITSFTGMTDKWFCTLISEGHFPKPIKLGRSSMKRVVMPVRWQCAKCRRWYCGNQPCPGCWRYSREPSSRHSPVSQQFVIIS
ncbi:hypothetical protein PTU37_004098 [Escherichia coli]|uniref:Putative regulatory protein n=1 Tax=Escherichia coli M605 TaxID=656417 RepID=F4T7M9_ECOLX|nr:hypothetical protein [Escherichia coli]EGI13306.1 putative regulatory protein [Escherichia coli M605]EFA4512792.1 hypothetical protein [Escherichia coli]EFA4550522.1 hypothetical protein [Escherichia coli]EFM0606560.1 hypothetical protein [Escherichia coli]